MSATLRKKRAARKKRSFQDGRRRIKKRLANTTGPERPVPMMTAQISTMNPPSACGDSRPVASVPSFSWLRRSSSTRRSTGLSICSSSIGPTMNPTMCSTSPSISSPAASGSNTSSGSRNDEVYLDALGVERIPDPTTAGDFCRRFTGEADVLTLMNAINEARLRVWAQQPDAFRDQAILDADSTVVETDAECKEGVDIAYDGRWGYHPLLISLANTAEPLYLLNRSGNRPSQERAGEYLDKAIALCSRAGFRTILLRGDTRMAENEDLDAWNDRRLPRGGTTIAETQNLDSLDDAGNIRFIFGYAAYDGLKARADALPEQAYGFLERPPRYTIQTAPASNPNGSKLRSSATAASRRSICSRRRSPSSTIGRRPARRAIG